MKARGRFRGYRSLGPLPGGPIVRVAEITLHCEVQSPSSPFLVEGESRTLFYLTKLGLPGES